MDELLPLLGKEQDFDTISAALRRGIRRLDPGGVGAFHITCADESEHEATQAFERGVCRDHLPRLKYAQAVPFRTINAGARYDSGTLAICEDHFALGQEREGFKLVIVKIQGHCSRARDESGVTYGQRERYGHLSTYCGAIAAMLGGAELPLVKEMQAAIDADAPGALDRITDGDRVAHAAVRIDDSVVMLGEMGDSPSSSHVHVYVEDVDATYQACLDAGAESVQEPVQKDDPDRRGGVKGPGGVTWWVSTHVGL